MTTVVITTTEPSYETQQTTIITRNDVRWRNRPQVRCMTTAVFIFLAGGMDLALGLGWNINTGIFTSLQFCYSWFIGVIAGAILAAPLIPYLPKRIYMIISSLLMLAAGIIYVSVPYEYDAIIAARYISGIGVGICTVAFIVHGSEIASPSYRGTVLALEQYAITFGIAIQVVYASQWRADIDFAANCVHGIFVIVFAAIALSSTYFIIESPVFYLRKGDDGAALECLRLLEQPQIVSNYTKTVLEELRNYVTQEENQSFMESLRKSILPLVKNLLFRSMVAFTFSLPLSTAIELSSFISLGYVYSWPPIVYAVLRLFGAFIALWLIDGLGRKIVPLFSLLCVGGFSIGYGVQFSQESNVFDRYQMSILITLMLIAQFFAGLFTPCSTVYLGEAFSMKLKPYMIALCVAVQQIVYIVTIVTYIFAVHNAFVYFITIGCIMVVLFVYFCIAMPETRKTTLSEAQALFRGLLYMRMY